MLLLQLLLGAKTHRLVAVPQLSSLSWRAGALWSGHGRHAVLKQLDGTGHVVTFVFGRIAHVASEQRSCRSVCMPLHHSPVCSYKLH
jgi:hypothetical protein